MSILKRTVFTTFAALAFSTSAGATIIDFNGLGGTAVDGYSEFNPAYTSSVTSLTHSGYQFASGQQYIFTPLWAIWAGSWAGGQGDDGPFTENGTDYVGTAGPLTMTSLTAPFSIASLDLKAWGNDMMLNTVTLTGVYASNGASISTSITLDPTRNELILRGNDFTNYALSGFTGLSSFTIEGNAPDSVLSIDNIDATTTSVPEPGTLAVFSLGLAGLAAMRRRKQK